MKKKALELLESAFKGPVTGDQNALLAIAYAILALVEVCEKKR